MSLALAITLVLGGCVVCFVVGGLVGARRQRITREATAREVATYLGAAVVATPPGASAALETAMAFVALHRPPREVLERIVERLARGEDPAYAADAFGMYRAEAHEVVGADPADHVTVWSISEEIRCPRAELASALQRLVEALPRASAP